MIDSKGRILSKLSIFDILFVAMVIGLIIGLAVKLNDSEAKRIIAVNDTTFYVTFSIEPVRKFSVDAISEGDLFIEQFMAPLGKVVKKEVSDAYNLLHRDDGTGVLAKVENHYRVKITMECTGAKQASGYYINGNRQVSAGNDLMIQSNMIICGARIVGISDTLE